MSHLTIDLSMSLDGYVAGPDPSQEDPLGAGGEGLHEWAFAAQSWQEKHGHEGGEPGPDADVIQERLDATGASIIQVHVAPVLLGSGARLLEGVSGPALEIDRVVASPTVTHLRYRVTS